MKKCPTVACPEGYKVQLVKTPKYSKLSPMFYKYSARKQSTSKGGTKSGRHSAWKQTLARKPVQEQFVEVLEDKKEEQCQEFRCLSEWKPPKFPGEKVKPCPTARCPPGYKVVYEAGDTATPGECKRWVVITEGLFDYVRYSPR